MKPRKNIVAKTCSSHRQVECIIKKNDYLTWFVLTFVASVRHFSIYHMECCVLGFLAPIFPLSPLLSWTSDYTAFDLNFYMLIRILCSNCFILLNTHTYTYNIHICMCVLLSATQYVCLRNSHSIEIQSNDLPISFYYTTVIKFYHFYFFEIQSIMYLKCELNKNTYIPYIKNSNFYLVQLAFIWFWFWNHNILLVKLHRQDRQCHFISHKCFHSFCIFASHLGRERVLKYYLLMSFSIVLSSMYISYLIEMKT